MVKKQKNKNKYNPKKKQSFFMLGFFVCFWVGFFGWVFCCQPWMECESRSNFELFLSHEKEQSLVGKVHGAPLEF